MACSTRFEYTSAYENKWLKFPVLCTKTVSEYIVGKKKLDTIVFWPFLTYWIYSVGFFPLFVEMAKVKVTQLLNKDCILDIL